MGACRYEKINAPSLSGIMHEVAESFLVLLMAAAGG
jgi:hypothetical protein